MDRNNASRQLLTVIGRLVACAVSLTFVCTLPAQADQADALDQPGDLTNNQNDLANTFVTQMHADPLVASCAAHGNFIASTSDALDHVEFPPSAFDSSHATVTPWNDSFDEGKQRVKVDTIVTVDGIGIAKDSNHAPYDLKFRCGYVGQQILAFSWNDPVPPLRARPAPRATTGGSAAHGGKHSTKSKKTTSKSKKKTASSHKSSATSTKSSKSTAKPATKSTTTSTTKKASTKKKSATQ